MFRKNIRHAMHILIFFVLLCFVVLKIGDMLEHKYSACKYEDFLAKDTGYEVFFMGSSHVQLGVNPMELYKKYGISSYNMANSAGRLAVTYWTLLNAAKVHEPKLVVVDLFLLDEDIKTHGNINFAHRAFDAFPLNGTKWRAVNDLFDDLGDRTEMLFPFVKYHSRWSSMDDGEGLVSSLGFEFGDALFTDTLNPGSVDENVIPDDYTVSMEYVEKLINFCKERGIEVLLCYIPCTEPLETQVYHNYGYVLAKKYGINYLDFSRQKDIVDYNTDFYDADGHLNLSGAKKVTDALGKYIDANYDISDYRVSELSDVWDEFYEEYMRTYAERLEKLESADEYLMMLNNDNFEVDIYLDGKVTESRNPLVFELIDNLRGISLDSFERRESQGQSDIEITVRRKDTGETVDSRSFDLGK